MRGTSSFADSHARSASFTLQHEAERRVCIVNRLDLLELLDLPDLVRELKTALDRRKGTLASDET
jgi:hypothetical protein